MTHWKKLTNPNYMGVYSLEDGADVILTIKEIKFEKVADGKGGFEDKGVCYFSENDSKPMIMNTTNLKTLAALFGSNYVEEWAGKKIQIGAERVNAFGTFTDALRVRSMLPNEEQIICEECGKAIMPANKMSPQQISKYTKEKYGKQLCAACASKKAKEAK